MTSQTEKPGKTIETGAAKKPATSPVPLKEECRELTAIEKLDPAELEPAPFTPARPAAIRRNAETEDLLNGMIAEMHYYMRALVLPSACDTIDASRRIHFIDTAGSLALTGAKVAESIARLRVAASASDEQRGQIIEAIARAG